MTGFTETRTFMETYILTYRHTDIQNYRDIQTYIQTYLHTYLPTSWFVEGS